MVILFDIYAEILTPFLILDVFLSLIQSGRDFLFLWSSHLKEEKTELLDFSFLSLRFLLSFTAVFVCPEMIFEMFGVCLD